MKIKIFCLLLLSTAAACSTKRNTFLNRKYHEVNTYYNVYFNGKESLKQASKKTEAIEPQNFDEILPVFAFEYPQSAGLVSSEAQRAIDKGTKSVAKHSITAKPKRKRGMSKEQREFYNKKEFNGFIDEAQLLVGKANVYLHEFGLAEEKFAFIDAEYPKESSIHEARIWQAILFSRNGEYVRAKDVLVQVSRKTNDRKTNDVDLQKVEPLLNAAFADLYIRQKKYAEAIPFLEKALKGVRGRNTKIRYNYILGQLYLHTPNNSKAAQYFSKVLKYNPPYFTAFSAEMAMAYAYDPVTQKGNIRKILEKALKNPQNAKYHDQIYYAFAKLEESEGNMPKAIDYYKQSTEATGINTRQKGLSYLALAEHYIKQPNYIEAYDCYDNAANMLGTDHSLYEETAKKATKYRKLALNMKIAAKEDSLQHLANLSEDDLNKLIDNRLKQEGEKKRKAGEDKARMEQLQSDIKAQSATGQWYFYNASSLSLGRTDFAMRWGERKLEDNWRRSNKGVQMQQEYDDDDYLDSDTESTADADTVDKAAALKAGIPQSDEARRASNEKIATAMFNIGEAFRDDLNEPLKAAAQFEKMNERFPYNTLLAESCVALYEIYKNSGNSQKAEHYRTLMLLNYPAHPKVLAATDPGFIARMKAKEAEEEADYNRMLASYRSNRKAETYEAATAALNKYPSGRLKPQFTLLKALSDNYNENLAAYRAALKNIVAEFKGNEAAVYAQSVLNELEKTALNRAAETGNKEKPEKPLKETETASNYSAGDGLHSFVVITDPKVNFNKLNFNINSFNADNFLEENYETQITDFADNKMIVMSKIKDRKTAMEYYSRIIDNKNVFKDISINDYVCFVILDSNLALMKASKSFLDYMEFFNGEYLK
ncbi:MAG: hypothetical protein LBD35_06845 [Prevotellaceae bacterium]|nr:hypothetical protein [Prevotellaceae bacterium]